MEKTSEFLQSEEWRKFQEAVGRKTYSITSEDFSMIIIEHNLPVVGKYFYVPRGPKFSTDAEESTNDKSQNPNKIQNTKNQIKNLINLAKKENVGWIRIDPVDDETLNLIKENISYKLTKAPHDMQPKEVFIIDIKKPEEELLAEMKQKTRYNIKLSQKRGVSVKALTNNQQLTTNNYFEEFLKLVKVTAKRDGITPHPESYYRQMFETIPGENLKLYLAEYEGKIIAANIVIHYSNTATYLHGASDNEHRNVMAPYLLQWQAILGAKAAGLTKYDLGGVKMSNPKSEIRNPKQIQNPNIHDTKYIIHDTNSWQGITRFKTGFAPDTQPTIFPGSYDIIINTKKYFLYKIIQKARSLF